MGRKYLIVHADDFGLSPGISRGILHSIRKGIVSSTSVIVDTPYLKDTKMLFEENVGVDWGLHVLIDGSDEGSESILRKTTKQLDTFRMVLKRNPSHIDYHKGFRFDKKIYFALYMFAMKEKLAFRYDNHHFVEAGFYGYKNNKLSLTALSEASLLVIVNSLKKGVTELICHPGYTSNRLKDPYRVQRMIEINTLTSKKIIHALKKKRISLINFRDYMNLNKND